MFGRVETRYQQNGIIITVLLCDNISAIQFVQSTYRYAVHIDIDPLRS